MTNTYIRDFNLYGIITDTEARHVSSCLIKTAGEALDAFACYNRRTEDITEAIDGVLEALYYDTLDDMIEEINIDEVEHYDDEVIIKIGNFDICLMLDDDFSGDEDDFSSPYWGAIANDMIEALYGHDCY